MAYHGRTIDALSVHFYCLPFSDTPKIIRRRHLFYADTADLDSATSRWPGLPIYAAAQEWAICKRRC